MKNFTRHSDFRYIVKFRLRNFRNPSKIFAIIAKFPGIAVLYCFVYCTSTASFLHHFAFISSLNFDMLMAGNSFNLHGSTHLDIKFDFSGRGKQKPAK